MHDIKRLICIIPNNYKIIFLILLAMSIFLSVAEVIGVSIVMPFITLASNPEQIFNNVYSKAIFDYFSFKSSVTFIIYFGFVLVAFYICRIVYTILYNYFLNKFTFNLFNYYTNALFASYIKLPYAEFTKKNTSNLMRIITNETINLSIYIQNLLMIFVEIFTILLLYVVLLTIDWKMTIVLTVFIVFMVSVLIFFLRNKIKTEGAKRASVQSEFFKIVDEMFGNFKLLKFIKNNAKVSENFYKTSLMFSEVNILNNVLSNLPKILLENIGFTILVVIVMYVLFKYDDPNFVLPIISVYALALYRILPGVNRILGSYNTTLFLSKSLESIHNELSIKYVIEGEDSIEFKKNIVLNNVTFEYTNGKPILNNINLTIHKYDRIAFVGRSGGGKTTLVDLIIGLYMPVEGSILLDGVKLSSNNIQHYRSKIGYIPQSVYLFDGTVGENVSFGYKYDKKKIIDCLKKANIYDFLAAKDGINTMVGNGGIQISGGQKQRIGIARALYNDPDILVLDEATSALDENTEEKIMDEIYKISKEKTLLIITHRLTTVSRCNKIYKVNNGDVKLLKDNSSNE
ncbi:MAG: ATP-binding cassette domain-containing protein [Campylobacter concisus]|jgi:wlab protein|nr:ATP-binding cassette domain-containing protein [Campylobacter concisus]MDU2008676.1 ATP-binding cassette domain-containing protein [Campylobacter concisus]